MTADKDTEADSLPGAVMGALLACAAAAAAVVPPRAIRVIARFMLNRDQDAVAQLGLNLGLIRGTSATDREVALAVSSYARYWQELISSLSPHRAREQLSNVRVTGAWDDVLARCRDHQSGVIIALPHMGNWDLAGAWASAQGLKVATVAERVSPPWLFEAFLMRRRASGLTVLAHDDTGKLDTLADHLAGGNVVAMICDRHMGATSGPSYLANTPVRLPTGITELARRTQTPIFPAALVYDEAGMTIEVGDPLHVRFDTPQDQALRDLGSRLTWAITRAPVDWHMLQPVFGVSRHY